MKDKLVDQILRSGPIPFERFMAEALYGEGGYFNSETLRSHRGGDFLTSPEVSPWFGRMIGRFADAETVRIAGPIVVVEVGAGSGSLLEPLVQSTDHDTFVVEASPAARRKLADVIDADRVFEDLDDVPPVDRGLIVANELIDNIPMALAQLTVDGWRERWVGVEIDRLVLVDAPARPAVLSWLERFAGPVVIGGWVEIQIEAGMWLEKALARLESGAVVLIDYGDTSEGLAPRRQAGTLRTYREHHLGPEPLAEPGSTDLTADVNFTALIRHAEDVGATVSLVRQDDFLRELGLAEEIDRMRESEQVLARTGDEMSRLAVRTERLAAETLLHPRGLGDFRVLIARK